MAKLVTLGLTKIEMGAVAADGGMGTTLTETGSTFEGSASLVFEDPEVTEFYCEESDDPQYQGYKGGKGVLKFTKMDLDAGDLVTFLGGTSIGTPKVFSAPSSIFTAERSIKLTPKTGMVINIVRAMVVAKVNYVIGKKDIFKVDITATILTPTKTATQPWTATNPA